MKNKSTPKCPVCGSSNFSLKKKNDGLKMGVCLNCTLAYAHPLIKGEEDDVGNSNSSITNADYYSNILKEYGTQSLLAKRKTPLMQEYWASIIGKKPITILEIGCGTGQYYEAWKEIGVNWTGIEINKEMLNFCRLKNIPVEEFDECIRSEKKYEVIFLSQVLEHILEPTDFLNKIGKLLAKDGILHIDVPNHDSITSLYRKINLFHNDYGFIQPMHHLIAYTKKSLAYLLEKNHYKVVHIDAYANDHNTFGQLLTSKTFLRRLLFWASGITNRGSLLVCIAKKSI